MKKNLLLISCFLLFFNEAFSQSMQSFKQNQASFSGIDWLKNVNSSERNAFVQNVGQWDDIDGAKNKGILYRFKGNNLQVSFTSKGLIYVVSTSEKASEREWEEYIEKSHPGLKEEEEREKREGKKEQHFIPKSATLEMNWVGANSTFEIVPEEMTSFYFNYYRPDIDKNKIIGNAKGFKKITYKNVYPFIDVEYTIHPEEGIKYSYILHPGANPAVIRMNYTGADIKLDAGKNLQFVTSGGNMTDHAPLTYKGDQSSGKIIESAFELINKNTIGFKLANGLTEITETTVIDPWQQGPSFPANNYIPEDVAVDGAGNVFVHSIEIVNNFPFASTPGNQRLDKYNSAGIFQWAVDLSASAQYTNLQGDVAADPAGDVYISIGLGPNNNTGFYNTIKINAAGTVLLWGNTTAGTGSNNMLETWTITFNCNYTQFYQSGGGRVVGGVTHFNMSVEEPVNAATGAEGTLIENDSLGDIYCTYYAPNSLVYHMTTDSNVTPTLAGGLGAASTGTHNNLICFNPGTGARLFRVQLGSGYNYVDGDSKAPFSIGLNSMVSSCQYLYTMSGAKLDRWNPTTGAHYNQVTISGGIGGTANAGSINSGILTDKCGNVYVGANGKIYVYDPTLNLINTISGLPGLVFDMRWTDAANTSIMVCGGTSNATTFLANISVAACTLPNQVTITPIQPTCSTPLGSASASATFCGAPYTYSWSNGQTGQTATGLGTGTYTVTVSSSISCPYSYVETQTVTINAAPGIPSASISSTTTVSCRGGNNGSATTSASGGSGSYTYSWAPSGGSGATASNLPAGSYTCTVTDGSGCSTTTSVLIGQPASNLSATSAVTASVTCNGANTGSGSVSASGGTPGYTYTWTPSGGNSSSASNLPAGTYTVNITDVNGCTTFTTVTITQPASALSATQSFTAATCGQSNGSASVNASGGTPGYTYAWTPSGGSGSTASGLSAANYTCTITDSKGCTSVKAFSITNASGPTVAVAASNSVSCNGGNNGSASVNASGGTPGYTYTWSPSGGNAASASNLPAGTYTCNVTDASGCLSNTVITIAQPGAALSATTSFTAAICGQNNGSASVNASGGTPGYTYTWTPSGGNASTASGLGAASYTCTITDANNCTKVATVIITSSSGPSATVASSASVTCNGANTGSGSVNASGGTPGYTYTWTPSGGNSSSASNLPAGNYTVNITDLNGCTTFTTVTITQPASALSATQSFTAATCGQSNGSASVNASGGTPGYTYTWTPSGGNASTASGLSAANYTCTITDANGCTSVKPFSITNAGGPTIAVAASGSVSCNGGTNGSASVNASGGTPGYTYTWSPSGGNASSASNLPAGTYTCNVTDASGCLSNTVITIAQPGAALSATTSFTAAICGQNNGSASVNATGGTAGYTYTWTPSGGNASTASGLPAASYTCSITDANNCTFTATANVTNAGGPSATVASSASVACNGGSTGSASVSVTGGTAAYTYTWSPSGGNASSATNLPAGSYTCNVTDANGCLTNTVVTISEATAIVFSNVTSTSVSCNGGNNGTASVTISGGTPTYTYSWAPSGGNANTASGLSNGNYTCTVTDVNGCSTNTVVTISQPAILGASISSTTNVLCNGASTGVATATVTGGTGPYTYTWSPSGGNNASATNLPAGNYTCTVTDANGCTKIAVTNINQPFPINLNISSSSNVSCNGGANGSVSVFTTGGTGPYTYTWSPSGGNSTTASNLGAGSYTCSMTDANGCTSNTVAAISEPAALVPAIASSTNLKCNADNSGSATASASGGTGPYTYAWLPSGGNSSTITPLAAGSYTCTVTDSKGCTKTTVAVITEPAALSPNPSVTPAGCSGGSNGSASVNITGGTSPYTISWSTVPVQTGTSATGLSAGVYTASITDNNNCVINQTVIVLDAPPVDSLEMIGTLCMNDSSVVLSAPHGGTAPNDMTAPYQWYGSGTPIPTATGVTYTANQSNANIYSVTWFYHGCRYVSTTLLETIYQDISTLPQTNIFTPNGDKINDEFLPFSLSTTATTVTYAQVAAVVEDYELYIYDRWGSLVFKTNQPLDMWDGVETNGKEANPGTYFWMAKYKTKCNSSTGQQTIKGFLQLIR